MNRKLNMYYWQEGAFFVGKLIEYPEIMSQGETLEELEENLKDAYQCVIAEDVPVVHKVKELVVAL